MARERLNEGMVIAAFLAGALVLGRLAGEYVPSGARGPEAGKNGFSRARGISQKLRVAPSSDAVATLPSDQEMTNSLATGALIGALAAACVALAVTFRGTPGVRPQSSSPDIYLNVTAHVHGNMEADEVAHAVTRAAAQALPLIAGGVQAAGTGSGGYTPSSPRGAMSAEKFITQPSREPRTPRSMVSPRGVASSQAATSIGQPVSRATLGAVPSQAATSIGQPVSRATLGAVPLAVLMARAELAEASADVAEAPAGTAGPRAASWDLASESRYRRVTSSALPERAKTRGKIAGDVAANGAMKMALAAKHMQTKTRTRLTLGPERTVSQARVPMRTGPTSFSLPASRAVTPPGRMQDQAAGTSSFPPRTPRKEDKKFTPFRT